jgi:hypothetical protein
LTRSKFAASALSLTPSHQQLPLAAPHEKLPPHAAHNFCAGSLAIDSRLVKPALMLDHFSWERA